MQNNNSVVKYDNINNVGKYCDSVDECNNNQSQLGENIEINNNEINIEEQKEDLEANNNQGKNKNSNEENNESIRLKKKGKESKGMFFDENVLNILKSNS